MDRSKWEYKKLGDISVFLTGCRPKGGVAQIKEGVHSLGGEHIGKDGYVDLSSPKFVSESFYYDNKKGHIKDNDILLCKDGALSGKVAIVRGELKETKAMVNEHVFIIRSDSLLHKYLFYYLFSPTGQYQLKLRISGAAQGGINGANLSTIIVPYPKDVSLQQRIVAELDCLNEMIAVKQEQLKEFDKLAQSIFYDMFGDPVSNEKGWETYKLGELGLLARGVSKHRPRNAPELLGGTMPLIQTGDVANAEMFITAYNSTYSDLGVAQSKVWKAGTLCITIAATIGKCAILSFDACFPDSVVGFMAESSKTNNEYMYFIFKRLQKILEMNAPAVAQKNINLAVLNALQIPLPPLSLQQQFAEKISAIEAQKELVKQSIAETQHLLDSRMDYYFD